MLTVNSKSSTDPKSKTRSGKMGIELSIMSFPMGGELYKFKKTGRDIPNIGIFISIKFVAGMIYLSSVTVIKIAGGIS